MKKYRVGTFWHQDDGSSGHATAKTKNFHTFSPGCRVYDVEAENAAEAKQAAINLRTRLEIKRAEADLA